MTDRELLELAAKACGWSVIGWDDRMVDVPLVRRGDGSRFYWIPLADDGDAFRLAVKLNLTTRYEAAADGAMVMVGAHWHDEFPDYWWNEWLEKDAASATRRAIVRAAAEIGSKP
jgi:hypothetical protein